MREKLLFALTAICLTSFVSFAQEKKDEFPKTKISGLIFGDYYYNAVRDTAFNPIVSKNAIKGNNALSGKQNENSFQIRRVLFAFEHKATKNVEALFRLESDPTVSYFSNDTAKKSFTLGKFSTFIKDVYFKWNYFQGHNVQFGVFSTGAWDVSESFWGHRYIEKTITDIRKSTVARDLGVGLNGKLDSIGKFKYSAMFGEGTGVNIPIADWYKRYYATFSYSPIIELNEKKEIVKELTVSIFYDRNEKKSIVDSVYSVNKFITNSNVNANSQELTFFTGYKEKDKYSFGLECYYSSSPYSFWAKDVTTPASSKFVSLNGFGVSIFGSYNVNEKIDMFARYDYFDPNNHSNKLAKGDTRNYIIAGCAYSPAKNVSISPNVLVETYEDKIDGITNPDGTKKNLPYKASITPRVTFYYIFK